MNQNPHIKLPPPPPLSTARYIPNSGIFCSPKCGANCLREDFDKAHDTGADLVNELGKGWTYTVWEAQGWYVKIESSDKRLVVYPPSDHRHLFAASLGAGHYIIGSGYLADGATAVDALEAVCGLARTTTHDTLAMLEGLEY